MRIRRNLESLSFRLVSRCLRTAMAFLMRWYRSSGMEDARPVGWREVWAIMDNDQHTPWLFNTRRILLPVTNRTWGMPCESRRVTPIWDGVRPLRASLIMCSTTSSGVVLSHDGGVRRYGRAEEAEDGSVLNHMGRSGYTTYRYPFRERAYDPWLL